MNRLIAALVLLLPMAVVVGQEGTPPAPIVVTASRTAQDPFEVPRSVDVITGQQLLERMPRTLQQSLRDLPSVLVQETASGQGSPFVRGFTGYRNLLLIDGIRLNNSSFRSGPNQYWSTIDMLALDRIEVVRGPSSTLWGSDAIGGTVQVFTRRAPQAAADGGAMVYGGSLFNRYATAEDSIQTRAEYHAARTWAGGSRTSFLLGGTAMAFGDIEGGRDTGRMVNTGYDETAYDLKIEHWFDSDTRLVFLHQNLQMDDVPRTHSTVFGISFHGSSIGSNLRRDYDQGRTLTYLQLHKQNMDGLVDGMRLSVSWQQQDQTEDRIRGSGDQTWQGFDVGTIGTFAQFEKDVGALGQLTFGFDYYHDNVNSFLRRASGPQPGDAIQGPLADDASYDLFGIYLQDIIALAESLDLQLGARYTYAEADADSVRDPQDSANQISLADDWDELTGSAHLRVGINDEWNVYGGVSQGFRAPTIYDMTSFDTARSGEQEVPSPGLQAEHFLGYELGTKFRRDGVHIEAAVYYTDIDDEIERYLTGTTAPNGDPIVTKGNVGDGYVQGTELEFAWECLDRTTLFGTSSWQYGRVSNFNSGGAARTEEFPSRLMPLTSMLGLRWENEDGRFHVETRVLHVDDADKTSAGDNRDVQRIPPGGTPGYTVWHLRAGLHIDDRTSFECALENITDADYRVHGSGSNMPGRSLVLGMRMTF